jgi:hypothetical protein
MKNLEDGSVMELHVSPDHPLPDTKKAAARAETNAALAKAMGATALAEQDLNAVQVSAATEWCKSQDLKPLTPEERSA